MNTNNTTANTNKANATSSNSTVTINHTSQQHTRSHGNNKGKNSHYVHATKKKSANHHIRPKGAIDNSNSSGLNIVNSPIYINSPFANASNNTVKEPINIAAPSLKKADTKKKRLKPKHIIAIICSIIAITPYLISLFLNAPEPPAPEPPAPTEESSTVVFSGRKSDVFHLEIPYSKYTIWCNQEMIFHVIPYVYLSLNNDNTTIYIPINGLYTASRYSSDEHGVCNMELENVLGDFQKYLSLKLKNTKWQPDVKTIVAIQYEKANSLEPVVCELREGTLIPLEEAVALPLLLQLTEESVFAISLQGWRQDQDYIVSLITDYIQNL